MRCRCSSRQPSEYTHETNRSLSVFCRRSIMLIGQSLGGKSGGMGSSFFGFDGFGLKRFCSSSINMPYFLASHLIASGKVSPSAFMTKPTGSQLSWQLKHVHMFLAGDTLNEPRFLSPWNGHSPSYSLPLRRSCTKSLTTSTMPAASRTLSIVSSSIRFIVKKSCSR